MRPRAASHMAPSTPSRGARGRREGRSCMDRTDLGLRAGEVRRPHVTSFPTVWRRSRRPTHREAQAVPTFTAGATTPWRRGLQAIVSFPLMLAGRCRVLAAAEMAEAGQGREERDQSGQRQESLHLHGHHLLRSGSPGAPRPRSGRASLLGDRRPAAPQGLPGRSRPRRDGWLRKAGRSSTRRRRTALPPRRAGPAP